MSDAWNVPLRLIEVVVLYISLCWSISWAVERGVLNALRKHEQTRKRRGAE